LINGNVGTLFIHRDCGGELLFIANVGVDVSEVLDVDAYQCDKCKKTVTYIETKEIEYKGYIY
jgi:hypothetical protein